MLYINDFKVLGYCPECGALVFKNNEIPKYKGIYECSNCHHPSREDELWDELPEYLKKDNKILEWKEEHNE